MRPRRDSFLDLYLRGEVQEAQLDDYIGLWHTTGNFFTLAEFLGMSDSEYAHWFSVGNEALKDIAWSRAQEVQRGDDPLS